MNFVLLRAEYDRHKERAYVEFRGPDEDGGDAIATAIFSYRTTERLSNKQVHEGRHGEAGEELAHFVLRTTRIADGTCRFGGRPYEAGYIPGSGMTSMISIHAPGICR